MGVELKPCPFCGGPACVQELSTGHSSGGTFIQRNQIGCDKCGIHFTGESRFQLVNGEIQFIHDGYAQITEMWNTRLNEGGQTIEFL